MSVYPTSSANATTTGAPATGPDAGAGAGGDPVISDDALVYTVDLILVILLAVYALVRLPRALALFGSSKEWLNGHIIRRVTSRVGYMTGGGYPPVPSSKENYNPNAWSSDDSHIPYTRTHPSQRLNEKGLPVPLRLPSHVAACPRLLRPFLTLLRMRVAPGFSAAQFVILTIYFFCVAYAGFYHSNIFADQTRTGWVAISQLPFVFAFAQKNNLLGSMLGYGYEKLNFLHRFAGRLVVLAANIHALHWIYTWSISGELADQLQDPSYSWGLVALICMDMLFFFSTEYWRKRAYNIFLSTHIFGIILVLPAMYIHQDSMLILILVCVGGYGMDHLLRMIKTRIATAHLRALPELEMTRVEIPTLNAGWRAGQHVRLRVLSTAMGWASWMEVHPFTIASVSKSEEGMVLMVKKAGGWTKKMYEVAKAGGPMDGGLGRDMKVIIEGPYGGPTHTIMASFSAAVFVVGGSGITFALSSIQDLIQKDLAGESRVKIIELVWIVSDPASLAPLLPLLSSLIQQSIFTPVRISVFYTRGPTGKQPAFVASSAAGPSSSPVLPPIPTRPPPLNIWEEEMSYQIGPASLARNGMPRSGSGAAHVSMKRAATQNAWEKLHGNANPQPAPAHVAAATVAPGQLPPGITLAPGRPRVLNIIKQALDRTLALAQGHCYTRVDDAPPQPSGLLVGVCGPLAMADDVIQAVGGIDSVRRDQVGGVEIVEEGFGW